MVSMYCVLIYRLRKLSELVKLSSSAIYRPRIMWNVGRSRTRKMVIRNGPLYMNYGDRWPFCTFEPLKNSLHNPAHILQSNKHITCARQMVIRVGLNQHLYYWWTENLTLEGSLRDVLWFCLDNCNCDAYACKPTFDLWELWMQQLYENGVKRARLVCLFWKKTWLCSKVQLLERKKTQFIRMKKQHIY